MNYWAKLNAMQFSSYFRIASYATIATSALALLVAGGVTVWLLAIFFVVMAVAFKLEETRWQLSERIALAVILSSIPVFYLDWRVLTPLMQLPVLESGQRSNPEVVLLSHLILFLSAVKLLQRKADRDWFFLYLISFFTVLLAAGLTAKPAFLAVLLLYLLCALSTVVAFEIQKARRSITHAETRLLVPPDSRVFRKGGKRSWRSTEAARSLTAAFRLAGLSSDIVARSSNRRPFADAWTMSPLRFVTSMASSSQSTKAYSSACGKRATPPAMPCPT